MKKDFFLPSEDGKIELGISLYEVENPKATIQFTHGMTGHRGVYDQVNQYLADQGYAVIASDNRGHGDSVNDFYRVGYMDHYENNINDQLTVWEYMDNRYPDLPHYSLSHSFGSMIMRVFMQEHDDLFEKMIFTGAPHYIDGSAIAAEVLDSVVKISRNEYFIPERIINRVKTNFHADVDYFPTDDLRIVFQEDEKVVPTYTLRGVQVIIKTLIQLTVESDYQVKNPDLQIMSLSGTDDFWAGDSSDVKGAMAILRDVGYNHVTMSIYPNMKHEILFECHPFNIVYRDLLRFLEN